MGKSVSHATNLLKQTFNGSAETNWSASGGTTSIWAALFTADPTVLGSTSVEGGYAAYARVLTDRSTGAAGWAVTSGTSTVTATVAPVSLITFPQNASTSTGTFTFFGLYNTSSSSAPNMIYSGAISPVINFAQNVTPSLTTSSSITEA